MEAALLMILMVPLLTGMIYLGFYLHDTALLKGAALETAAYISLRREEEDIEKKAEEIGVKLIKARILGIKKVSQSINVDKKQAEVKYCGQMVIPGFILNYFLQKRLSIEVSASVSIQNPAETIHKFRAAKKLLELREQFGK